MYKYINDLYNYVNVRAIFLVSSNLIIFKRNNAKIILLISCLFVKETMQKYLALLNLEIKSVCILFERDMDVWIRITYRI